MVERSTLNTIALLIAIFGGTWEYLLKPNLKTMGYGRVVESINNDRCETVPELSACESESPSLLCLWCKGIGNSQPTLPCSYECFRAFSEIVLHQPTGILYLACSTPQSRVHWTPAVSRLNATGASRTDYVATYDPATKKITKLIPEDLTPEVERRGFSLHGMDVVPADGSKDGKDLYVYLVNHRAPLVGDAKEVGADSVIQVFKIRIGDNVMRYVATVEHDVIITPNDIVGGRDGKSFWFTNDHIAKVGIIRELSLLGHAGTSVGYCSATSSSKWSCHFAIEKLHGANGIARSPNPANKTVYVANAYAGGLYILEEVEGKKLVKKEVAPTDRGMDNISVDADGHVWAAAFPSALTLTLKHFANPTKEVSPSSAIRFTVHPNPKAIDFGINYKIEKV
ncbi:hypothetical protein CVT24_012272 [Panaeolus cyanescens]|uniref:SMP-30/Gluconolactonase/LRE-like region domain-containing protein n=1 Tax=Panaeolus cyanescens TaxID=181874 RepID=A0A409WK40_9AGAR|nr:hypothetical protein CVT24_012272 [Panaeolus cyanescens]